MSKMKELYEDIVERLDERQSEEEIAYWLTTYLNCTLEEANEMVDAVARSMEMVYTYR